MQDKKEMQDKMEEREALIDEVIERMGTVSVCAE